MFGSRISGPSGERAERVAQARCADGRRWLAWAGGVAELTPAASGPRRPRAGRAQSAAGAAAGPVGAPCAGRLTALAVAVGDRVEPGQRLATMEAMKMEFPIAATAAGRVAALPAAVGQVLAKGDVLVELAPP